MTARDTAFGSLVPPTWSPLLNLWPKAEVLVRPTEKRSALLSALKNIAPAVPRYEAGVVVDMALDSLGLRTASVETAAWLSLVAYARHACTDYDALLADGYDQESARFFVRDALNATLRTWGCRRTVPDRDGDS